MKKPGGSLLLALGVATFFLCPSLPAFAQPTNDFCTNAIDMSMDTVYAIDTSNATSTDDPTNVCSSPFGKGVWFRFTAPRNGILTLNTCGSDFDTVIGIYTGTCGALADYSCADDNGPGCLGPQASISFPVTQSTTFYIVAGGYDGAGGHLQFTASISPPANDQCAGAISLTNDVRYVMDTVGTAKTNDVLLDGCNLYAGYGVWFSYTPTNTGLATVSTAGSEMDTAVEVFTGDCGNLNKLTCTQGQPTMQFQATNGVTYLLYVAGYQSNAPKYGALQIVVEQGSLSNDTCDSAIPLTNGILSFADTVKATSTGDPLALNGIWYTFTPESNGVVTLSTCGSDFSTVLQVYTGSCGSLSALAGGYNYGYGPACSTNASVSFETAGGVTYYILVGGNSGTVGKLQIQATLSPSLNDHCQNAIPMQDGIIYTRSLVAATTNGDPPPSCDYELGNGVWYTYTPASNGVVTISTCGSDFETAMQVYSGNCDALIPQSEGCSVGYGPVCTSNRASVSFEGGKGVTYYVLVGKAYSFTQPRNLQIQATLSPSLNDRCEFAIPMQDGIVYARNTVASTSAGDPGTSCAGPTYNGVWYTYTPGSDGVVTVSTCGSDYNTVLQVFTGECGAFATVADGCNSGYGVACPTNRASVLFEGAAGTTYYILVGAQNGRAGNLQIQATLGPSLPNDHCAGAIVLTNGVTSVENTVAATAAGDPGTSCGGYVYNGVWYTFTPANNGVVTVSTCGSDYNTVLQVFSGQCGALTSVFNACNSGYGIACPTNRASVYFDGSAGTTYYILAGARFASSAGNLQIQATLAPLLPNDNCDGAIVLTNGVTYAENTIAATSFGGNPYYDSKGVWFSFTPPTNGMLTISTCGSDYHTDLEVYTGGCNSLTIVPDGYNWGYGSLCQDLFGSVVFPASAGTNYLILVNGYNGDFGNLQIQATLQPPLPNDQCSGAIDITDGAVHSADTTLATSTGDVTNFYNCGGNVKGIWYRITPPADTVINLHLQTTNLHPTLQLFGGTCGQLSYRNCAYNYAGYHVDITFSALAGHTYFMQAGAISRATGYMEISAGALPPANDWWGDATPMVPGFKYEMNTFYASSTNDPVPSCDATAGHGVWYSYTPKQDAQVTVETCDSDFETVMQAYSYDGSSLIPVACNDGFGPVCATNRASLSFFGKTGTNYFILVAGKNGTFGNLSLSVNSTPPANDNCDAAIDMTEGVVYTTNTTYASSAGDAFSVIKGVWYKFTPTRQGLLLLNTCGSDFNTAFNVYTGACDALSFYIGAVTDGSGVCRVRASSEFLVSPGTTYYIDVGGFLLPTNNGNLSIVATMPPPANDTCAGAIALSNGQIFRMNNANATETGDPTPLCQTNFGKGVWFTYTPPMSGTVSLSTCDGDLDTVLQVYTGGCGALTPVANSCNDDAGPDCNGFTASVHFHGDAGVTYWILVGGYGGAGGSLAIVANVMPVLTFQRTGTNSVLSWPQISSGYYPEFATNLNPPILWKPVPFLSGTGYKDGNFVTTNSTPGNPIYFRLRKQR